MPLPPPSRGRTGTGGKGERRGKNYVAREARREGGGEREDARESTRWKPGRGPSQDEERPPREEWPTAMKILTGTLALADRPTRSFYYCFFPAFLSSSLTLSFSRCLSLPLPALVSVAPRERFTEAAAVQTSCVRPRRPTRSWLPLGTEGFCGNRTRQRRRWQRRKDGRMDAAPRRYTRLACTRLRDKRRGK